METKPLLMPYGSTRKKNVKGLVVSRLGTSLLGRSLATD
jgi:hypothetical protein